MTRWFDATTSSAHHREPPAHVDLPQTRPAARVVAAHIDVPQDPASGHLVAAHSGNGCGAGRSAS
ncbi:hypothetical protein [Streptomyces silvisoli]|uniref:Uncharacterized protein n=1 Tax=Streptomyces silvisoli TaxID=3034235 RepID=A0ABT5ZEU1_9ACTN|nr:hypothetical protein [Streptomyces silvisoli]MDF3288348.1 hypothetical protein [Streptomyces silvisoli]